MSRKILVHSLPTTKAEQLVEVEMYYDEGGANYFAGGVNLRGYYLAVQPVRLTGDLRSITAFSETRLRNAPPQPTPATAGALTQRESPRSSELQTSPT